MGPLAAKQNPRRVTVHTSGTAVERVKRNPPQFSAIGYGLLVQRFLGTASLRRP